MNKKIAQKWKKRQMKKDEENVSAEAITFKTHQVSESEAEIIIPPNHEKFNYFHSKPNLVVVIDCGKEKILVQMPQFKHGATSHQDIGGKKEISVLKTLLDIEKIQCGPTGMFKGEMKPLQGSKIGDYSLEIIEFLIKETYFSRRDHYKVIKALKDSITHVYLKKTLYFDEIALEVHAMMRSNQSIVKSGIIDKNTKIIFRTSCSKLTVGIELSIETFQLNDKKQLYLQKMIEFLYVYLQRSNFFNATHRLTIIFYGRCFYPQFKTLRAAYDRMLKENTSLGESQKFQKNFAVALQKDDKGRIFQDVYRRIIWFSEIIDNFREFVWEKISEFLFTLNCDFSQQEGNLANFITKSLSKKMLNKKNNYQQQIDLEDNDLKIRPFVHKLKSQLSCSKDSNLFEAISLISQQYRHHYQFRSLTESGNTIILLSAGPSEYDVDQISYKMAKSYVYLTNVYCSFINFRTKTEGPIKANIVYLSEKPIFKDVQAKKLLNLSLHCIEKQFYISPTNEETIVYDEFCNKNCIYPDQLILASPELSKQLRNLHHCDNQVHYELVQKESDFRRKPKEIKQKLVSFIHTYSIDDRHLHLHKLLYDKLYISESHLPSVDLQQQRRTELDIFETNLNAILVTKQTWGIEAAENEVSRKIQSFREYLQHNRNKSDKSEKTTYTQRTAKVIFKMHNHVEQNMINQNKFETSSITEGKIVWSGKPERKRRTSESFRSQFLQGNDHSEIKGKVNIFEETFKNKNHEYTARQTEDRRAKKHSSHNKERMKNVYPESNIHYLMPNFTDSTLKKFRAFVRSQYIEELKDEEDNIVFLFEGQKMWKNLTYPLLTPIYTKYTQNFKNAMEHRGSGVTQQTNDKRINILEDEICKLLMKNYQIEESQTGYNLSNMVTKLSKGHISCVLKMTGKNLASSYIIDLSKQQQIIPCLLYRYLSYEDKDCRFCQKYIYFKDKNKYTSTLQMQTKLETKIVKIVLCSSQPSASAVETRHTFSGTTDLRKDSDHLTSSFIVTNKKDPFQEFMRMLKDKYKQLGVDISMISPHTVPATQEFTLNFSKNQSRALYNHQEVKVAIDRQYNPTSLFKILISWNLCSSVIVNEFVENIMTLGRRSKLRPALLSSGNIFHTIWSITTIGEIIFQHRVSLQLLQQSISETGEWLWDSEDYYFHVSGIAFIKFNKEKKMILWRDNNHEKRSRDIKKDDSSRQYIKFFMKSAIFDFLGNIIEDVCSPKIPNQIHPTP